jgi:hypothetical protein
MKFLPMLTIAGLFVAGTVFAADSSTAAAKPAATAAAQPDHHCRDAANEKKLSGAARTSFVKKCRADAMKKK